MKPIVLDASVVIAAAEPKDAFHAESRRFLEIVMTASGSAGLQTGSGGPFEPV